MVELPPRSTLTRFQDINDDDDEYEPEPMPPTPRKHKEAVPGPQHITVQIEVYKVACERCQKGDRDCEPMGKGDACRACKEKKYKCSHTGQTTLKTMWVTWPALQTGTEIVVEETAGKKRKAVSPGGATKRKVKVVKEEVEKPKKSRETKVKVEKAKGSGRRRAPPKSAAVVELTSAEEFEEIDEEDEESDEEPKPKRARVRAPNDRGEY